MLPKEESLSYLAFLLADESQGEQHRTLEYILKCLFTAAKLSIQKILYGMVIANE